MWKKHSRVAFAGEYNYGVLGVLRGEWFLHREGSVKTPGASVFRSRPYNAKKHPGGGGFAGGGHLLARFTAGKVKKPH